MCVQIYVLPPILRVAMARTLCVHTSYMHLPYYLPPISRCDNVISSLHPLSFSLFFFTSLLSFRFCGVVFFRARDFPLRFFSFMVLFFPHLFAFCEILRTPLGEFPCELLSDDGCQVRGCMYTRSRLSRSPHIHVLNLCGLRGFRVRASYPR